jgi:Membrane-associated phospholipid phosphatase
MLQSIYNFDGKSLLFIQEYLRNPILTPVFKVITSLGNESMIWLMVIIILILNRKYRQMGLVALISVLMCYIINNILLKNCIARPRPFEVLTHLQVLIHKPTDYSFPSGHAASSFAAAGAFYFYGSRKWGGLAFVLAALIGFSRLYLGVHYPTDVLFGAMIGLLISFLTCKIFALIQEKLKEKVFVK